MSQSALAELWSLAFTSSIKTVSLENEENRVSVFVEAVAGFNGGWILRATL
jgi:hypothetical protein